MSNETLRENYAGAVRSAIWNRDRRVRYEHALRDGVARGETPEIRAWCALVLERVEREVPTKAQRSRP